MKKSAVISLSGGMDSTCLLINLIANGYDVYGLSFDYGQKHKVELERLEQNIKYLRSKGYHVVHDTINLSQIGKLFNSSLLKGGSSIPEGHYQESNMKSTVVPNRNSIFSSLIFGYALSISQTKNTPVDICLGVHSGDHAIYPDCRPSFYKELERVFKIGNWDSENVNFKLPYLQYDKTEILKDCLVQSSKLKLDFDTILKNTNTSYNPNEKGQSSGVSGADIERIEAFININRKDPVPYAKSWEWTLNNAKKILNNE